MEKWGTCQWKVPRTWRSVPSRHQASSLVAGAVLLWINRRHLAQVPSVVDQQEVPCCWQTRCPKRLGGSWEGRGSQKPCGGGGVAGTIAGYFRGWRGTVRGSGRGTSGDELAQQQTTLLMPRAPPPLHPQASSRASASASQATPTCAASHEAQACSLPPAASAGLDSLHQGLSAMPQSQAPQGGIAHIWWGASEESRQRVG